MQIQRFLRNLGIWKHLKSNFESIDKIVIKDYVNKEDLIFTMLKYGQCYI